MVFHDTWNVGLLEVDPAGREHVESALVVVKSEANLLEIIFALSSAGSFPRLLNGRQQQCHQNCNDGDHHQQLNQRKASLLSF
jgi:hypothetical protein